MRLADSDQDYMKKDRREKGESERKGKKFNLEECNDIIPSGK